jgi:hypothetical protein
VSGPGTDCSFKQSLKLRYHHLLLLDCLLIQRLLLRLLLHLHQLLLASSVLYLHRLQLLLQSGYHLYVLEREPYLVLELQVLRLPPLVGLCHFEQLGLDLAHLHLLHHFHILPVHLAYRLLRLNVRLQPCILDLKGFNLGAEGQDLMALGLQLVRPLIDVSHHSLDDLLLYL